MLFKEKEIKIDSGWESGASRPESLALQEQDVVAFAASVSVVTSLSPDPRVPVTGELARKDSPQHAHTFTESSVPNHPSALEVTAH